MVMEYRLKTQGGHDFLEVVSALQKEIRRANERAAVYWAFELIPRFEAYLWKRLKVVANEDVGIAAPEIFAAIQALAEQYFEMRARKDGSCTLCLTNAVLLMCRAKKTRVADHLTIITEQTKARELDGSQAPIPIPDYALDMHTLRGRQMGRGLDHFRTEGAKLVGRDESVKDPYADEAYRLLRHGKKWPLEPWPAPKGQAKEKPDESEAEGSLF